MTTTRLQHQAFSWLRVTTVQELGEDVVADGSACDGSPGLCPQIATRWRCPATPVDDCGSAGLNWSKLSFSFRFRKCVPKNKISRKFNGASGSNRCLDVLLATGSRCSPWCNNDIQYAWLNTAGSMECVQSCRMDTLDLSNPIQLGLQVLGHAQRFLAVLIPLFVQGVGALNTSRLIH
jgi:hypothetical protein